MNWRDKVQAIVGLMVLIAVIATLYGWPDKIVTLAITWGTSLIVGVIASGISGELVERFSGDVLKNISWTVEIGGMNFSISLFFLVTVMVRFALFG